MTLFGSGWAIGRGLYAREQGAAAGTAAPPAYGVAGGTRSRRISGRSPGVIDCEPETGKLNVLSPTPGSRIVCPICWPPAPYSVTTTATFTGGLTSRRPAIWLSLVSMVTPALTEPAG